MNVFQMELIKDSDKKECQVCGRVNDPSDNAICMPMLQGQICFYSDFWN